MMKFEMFCEELLNEGKEINNLKKELSQFTFKSLKKKDDTATVKILHTDGKYYTIDFDATNQDGDVYVSVHSKDFPDIDVVDAGEWDEAMESLIDNEFEYEYE